MAFAGLVTISQVGEEIAACLVGVETGNAEARRLAFSFVEHFDKANLVQRQAMDSEAKC